MVAAESKSIFGDNQKGCKFKSLGNWVWVGELCIFMSYCFLPSFLPSFTWLTFLPILRAVNVWHSNSHFSTKHLYPFSQLIFYHSRFVSRYANDTQISRKIHPLIIILPWIHNIYYFKKIYKNYIKKLFLLIHNIYHFRKIHKN